MNPHDRPDAAPAPEQTAASLRAEHDALDALAARIVAELREGDRDDVNATIATLQAGVLAHLDGEEREILRVYANHDPNDAEILLREHAAIRAALADMDVATDLHLVRADAVAAFMDRLRAHAERENRGMYAWAALEHRIPPASP